MMSADCDKTLRSRPVPVPDQSKVGISLDDGTLIEALNDLCIEPRQITRKWALITGQTGQAKVSYLGQHLASVHTGVRGTGSAARGLDLSDGTEVKTCSRADQLGKCKDPDCGARVQAFEEVCPTCGGDRITRKADSHWLFAVRKEEDLHALLRMTDRVMLQLFDRDTAASPHLRFRVWEIWAREPRHQHFALFIENYFRQNFDVKKERAAPANLHPFTFDFYMCNPVLTLDAMLWNADPAIADDDPPAPTVEILQRVLPSVDRSTLPSEPMPPAACSTAELRALARGLPDDQLLPCLRQDDAEERLSKLRRAGTNKNPAKSKLTEHLQVVTEDARSLLEMREKRIRNAPVTAQVFATPAEA